MNLCKIFLTVISFFILISGDFCKAALIEKEEETLLKKCKNGFVNLIKKKGVQQGLFWTVLFFGALFAVMGLQKKELSLKQSEYFENYNNNWYYYKKLNQSDDKEISLHDPFLIYLHGFGEHDGSVAQQYFANSLPYYVPYHLLAPCLEFTNKKPTQRKTRIFNTSFGGKNEILQTLYGIKHYYLDENQEGPIIMVCRSRGGACGANVLGILSQADNEILKTIGIAEEQRTKLIDKIKAGKIIFTVPLIDMTLPLKNIFGRLFNFVQNSVLKNIFNIPIGFSAASTKYVSVPIITFGEYNPFSNLVPMKSIKKLHNDELPITVIFAKHDQVVGNERDNEFINILKEKNGIAPEVIHVEGGHNGWQNMNTAIGKISTYLT